MVEEEQIDLTDEEWLTMDILRSRLEPLGSKCPLRYLNFHEVTYVSVSVLAGCGLVFPSPACGMIEGSLGGGPVAWEHAGAH